MKKYTQLNASKKAVIIALHKENLTYREIAEKIGCNNSTVTRLLRKVASTGSSARSKGSGRKRLSTVANDRVLKRLSLRNRRASAPELKRQWFEMCGVDSTVRTVQLRLNEMKIFARRPAKKPFLTKQMRAKRLIFAKEHETWTVEDWQRVIFSDESKFNLHGSDGKRTIRRRKGEKYIDECLDWTVKHSPSVMIWGCITSAGLGKIEFIEGTMNAKKYIETLERSLFPTIEELYADQENVVFQDDSAPCHRAKAVSFN